MKGHTRIDRGLTRVVLPEGGFDLAANVRSRGDVLLSAMGRVLLAQQFRPALVGVLIETAADVPGGDIFAESGTLPSPRWFDPPLGPDARPERNRLESMRVRYTVEH